MNQSETNTGPASLHVFADLQAALDSADGDCDDWTAEWHVTLGAVAGLLIAKLAGFGEALGMRDNDEHTVQHARALLEALGAVSTRTPALRNLEPVRLPVIAAATTTPETYKAIVRWVHGLNLRSHEGLEIASDAFDSAVRSAVHHNGKETGEYITPLRVADLMLELAKPTPDDQIYDPCFGFGELLLGAARRIGKETRSSRKARCTQSASIFGVEIGAAQYAIGLCRLLLAGVSSGGFAYGDALDGSSRDRQPEEGFDCILAVPPWGRWSGSSESDFLQHVMSRLRPGGRAVVAMSESALFRAGSDQRARKELLSKFSIKAVVALPRGAFAPYVSIPGSLVVFARVAPRASVRFVTVSSETWDSVEPDVDYPDGRNSRISAPPIVESQNVLHASAELNEALCSTVDHPLDHSPKVRVAAVRSWDVRVRELANRDYDLTAKESGSQALEAALQRLSAADPSMKIERLRRLAEVRGGLSYQLRFRTRHSDGLDISAGLVYAADVTDYGIRPPNWFLAPAGTASVAKNAYLHRGDLVVTTSGTVGKIGLVENGMFTMLAATGVAQLRPRSGIDPQFLAAVLRSPVYETWFSGHVRGPALSNRRLRLRLLQDLKVPVPSLLVQHAVVGELRGQKGDAMAVLSRLMSGTLESPVITWLETPVASRLATSNAGVSDGLEAMDEIARGIRSLASSKRVDREIWPWLEPARRAAAVLDGIGLVPAGTGRLAILELALARFHESLGELSGAKGPIIERLRSVTRAMVEIAESEVRTMQHSGALGIDVAPAEVEAGVATEVRLRLTNMSTVPIRSVRITVRQLDGTVDTSGIVYLAEREDYEVPVVIHAQDSAQSVRIAASWHARRLDATPIYGAKEISLSVRSNSEAVDSGDLGPNPYYTGSTPVDRPQMFFGREEVMERIGRQLRGSDHANVVLLEGNRRTGKTSILKIIKKTNVLNGWIPVYCSLQGNGVVSTPDFFRVLTRETGYSLHAAGIATWLPGTPRPPTDAQFRFAFRESVNRAFAAERAFETFQAYLSSAVEAAHPRRILLMLDEFDELQDNIDAGLISSQVPKNLRNLLQHQSGLSAIITGSRRMKRLREEYWSALFGLGYRIGISNLPLADAKRLVVEPVQNRLRYLPQACNRLVELCSCHPFLLQLLCSRVFDRAAAGNGRIITTSTVEKAASDMVVDNDHFQALWNSARTERRKLILMLCDRLSDSPDPINYDLLEATLQGNGVPIYRIKDLAEDMTELRELELVEYNRSHRGGTYQLCVPLMAKWIRQNIDYHELIARATQEVLQSR